MRHLIVSSAVVAAALMAASTVEARSYILVGKNNKAPAASAIASAGGSVTYSLDPVGAVVVESQDANFSARAAALDGVAEVLPNVTWKTSPIVGESVALTDEDAVAAAIPTSPFTDNRLPLQWGLDAIKVGGAWSAGHFGQGVRVAVLDSGVASSHPDIAPRLNTALSRSFVPTEAYNFTGFTSFNHGTHVAGIIAAPGNNGGTVGVAPRAELVAVKVLSALSGSGSFGGIAAGVLYAASIEADVVNMSLGAEFPRNGFIDDNGTPADPSDDVRVNGSEIGSLVNLMNKVTTYATQQGCTIIVAAGNSGIDRDHDASYYVTPADSPHVISVSATAPIGWAKAPNTTFLDYLTSYSNFGQSRIDLAAPGGDDMYPTNENILFAGLVRPVWVFDLVFAPGNVVPPGNPTPPGAYYAWAGGTSMAAPHVSGVAALIIGKNGGKMSPAAVKSALHKAVDDLGKPGNDDAYGAGRINATKAVQ